MYYDTIFTHMKKILKFILVSTLIFIPSLDAKAAEDIADELLETKFADEIVLNTNPHELSIDNKNNNLHKRIAIETTPTEENLQTGISQTETPKEQFKELFRLNSNIDRPDGEDSILDNNELDFEIFRRFDKDNDNQIDKDTLLGKIYHTKITRTDIQSFLLQDELTHEFEKGPLHKVQMYAGYRGGINAIFDPHSYSTEYDNATTEIGAYGSFKNPNYKFKFNLNPVPSSGRNYLDSIWGDAYIMNTSIPNHQIVVGYSRVQTGIEGGSSSFVLPFVARSQIARNFGNSRSLSVKIMGNYKYADYTLAAGSSGRSLIAGFPGTEFTGWLNVKPFGSLDHKLGKLTIGGGFSGGHNQINYSVGSLYIGYRHKKLWTNFEASIADGYNGSQGVSENKACGYAYTIGWKFTPQFQLIGRVDQFDPNRDVSGDLRREYTIGINWFIKGQALKVILNYVFCDWQNREDSHRLILATQILL